MKTPARIAYEAALKSGKKGGGRYPVAPKEQRTIDGITFDSKAEAKRYATLKMMQRIGTIKDLQLQPEFKVSINGHYFCTYRADFAYRIGGEYVVEDAKSSGTAKDAAYRLRKRAAELYHGISVREV